MTPCTSPTVIQLVVVAHCCGAAIAARKMVSAADQPSAFSQDLTLPEEASYLIAEILALKDLYAFSLRDVRLELERMLGLPSDALKGDTDRIKNLTDTEIARIQKEAAKRHRGIGSDCIAGGFWDFDFSRQGNCTDVGMKCYGPNATVATSKAAGKCYVAHKDRCYQHIAGDGTSGGCVTGTTCRSFRVWSQLGSVKPSNTGMNPGTTALKVKSYCVDPDSKEDNNLNFLTYFHYAGTEVFVGERVYKTD